MGLTLNALRGFDFFSDLKGFTGMDDIYDGARPSSF